jgi:hypothetical protein
MVECPVLRSEYIGSDSARVCRKQVAKQIGFKCPRVLKPWTIHASCFRLEMLIHKTAEATEKIFHPDTAAICGTGQPDVVVKANE